MSARKAFGKASAMPGVLSVVRAARGVGGVGYGAADRAAESMAASARVLTVGASGGRRCVVTRGQFEAKAIRDAERKLGVPSGWWGSWQAVYGPSGVAVRFSGACWVLRHHSVIVSKHDSRTSAIAKGRKLT